MEQIFQRGLYTCFFIATSILSVLLAVICYMSHLGLGFANWPNDQALSKVLSSCYTISYFIRIPALILAQIGSLALYGFRNSKAAYLLPAINVIIFLALISPILYFIL